MLTFVYGICAAIGGTVLVVQFVFGSFGFGDDDVGDVDDMAGDAGDVGHAGDSAHDGAHGSTWLFGVITAKTVIAALAFFGLAGLAGQQSDWSPGATFAGAILAGAGAMYGVHALMRLLVSLRADGTARVGNSVGCTGTVYLRVPARRGGVGKVQVSQQSRTVEYEAVTSGNELPVGANIKVVKTVGSDTVEVEASS